MNFKSKKISKKEKKESTLSFQIPKPQRLKTRKLQISLPIIGFVIVILLITGGIVKALKSIDFTVFLEVAGEDLEKDAFGHTNFLLLGTGDKTHEGSELTDTIILASLDYENQLVTMLSIPRDLYIKDEEIGSSRINEVVYNATNYFGTRQQGIEHMKSTVEKIAGVPIHYWIRIDFQGFVELVDALGGIDVNVENPIYDPYYPKDGTFQYETFSISAGQHHLDGATALKYARSRKTTSDFDRAKRQQDIIYAIKEKALQTEIIFDKDKITAIMDAIKNNFDTNIKIKEILTLGALADKFSKDNINHRLIHDNPVDCGGFLYTPAREFYNGMFVLIPAGGFEFIHRYAELNFNHPLIAQENAQLHILNGTKTGGVAGEAKQILQRYCFDVVRFGNATIQDIPLTTYYYEQKFDEDGEPIDSRPEALDFLTTMIPGQESTEIPQEYITEGYFQSADILLEIGLDYVNSEKYLDDPFYYLPAAPVAAPAAPATEAPATEAPAESSETTE